MELIRNNKLFSGIIFTCMIFASCIAETSALDLPNGMLEELTSVVSVYSELTAGCLTPIVFYGRVVDQNGDPVNNAEIEQDIDTMSTNPFTFFRKKVIVKTRSDVNGYFILRGLGRSIHVYVSPDDYDEYETIKGEKDKEFHYAHGGSFEARKEIHNPDSDNPVLFRLRKRVARACRTSSYNTEATYYAKHDGTWYYSKIYGKSVAFNEFPNVPYFYSWSPFLKSKLSRQIISEDEEQYTLEIQFLGGVDLQPEAGYVHEVQSSGYSSSPCVLRFKIVDTQHPWGKSSDWYTLRQDNTWEKFILENSSCHHKILDSSSVDFNPYMGACFVLNGKLWNKYYAKIIVHCVYMYGKICQEVFLRFNPEEGNRCFEDDDIQSGAEDHEYEEYMSHLSTMNRILYNENRLEPLFNEAYNAYTAARAVYQNDATSQNELLMEKKLDVFYVFGPSCLPYLLNKMQSEPTEDKRLIDMFNRLLGHGSSYHRGAKYKNLSQCVAGWNFYSRYYQEMLDGTYKYRPYEEIMREEGHQ